MHQLKPGRDNEAYLPVAVVMKSLKALTEHLRSLQFINDDAFDSWVEKGTLEYSDCAHTEGFSAPVNILLRLPYTAVFSWESWTGNAYELFAAIVRWLRDKDYDFDHHGFPEFTVVMLDDESSDVQITIHFEDNVYEQGGVLVEPDISTVDELGTLDHA